ncbi:transposase [Streptomyces sp. NPDC002225]|uniref:transposase n=1 Tax=Streptomyces sp. NPDC002225 TaxID=3154413 RepID=UPI003332149D
MVELAARIRKVRQDSDGTYGAPRTTAELREDGGLVVNHKRVARNMRTVGLEGVRLRHRHRTTIADPAAARVPAEPPQREMIFFAMGTAACPHREHDRSDNCVG